MSKVFFEPQIQKRRDDSFVLHVTVSRHDGVWTSPPVVLAATDWATAQAEAKRGVTALMVALTEVD